MLSSRTATAAFALVLVAAAPAPAPPPPPPAPLQARVEAKLAEAGAGPRFGLVVAAEDGRELVAIAPEGRFVPASTTKLFTVGTVFADLPGIEAADATGGAAVWLEGKQNARPDVVLEGHGDARLSSAADCREDCLAALADAVAARMRKVRDVIGDDGAFPDQRWSPGMSWNNMATESGTAVSALTLDDNELALVVTAAAPGQAPHVETPTYYTLRNDASTVAASQPSTLDVERLPGSRLLRLTGTIPAGATPQRLRLGIDDPADYAASRLAALLAARGVRVTGKVAVRHRSGAAPPSQAGRILVAKLTPPPLLLDLRRTMKASQNLHAELLLRRLGATTGTGSIADGLTAVRAALSRAGISERAVDLSDGSGMSTYNRVTPRGVVAWLRWAAGQPWGGAWRATLPVGGVDGTLARRFRGGPLEGRISAKTGTLNQTSALAGYLVARSGRTLTFAAYANDIPQGVGAAKAMDAALELIAAEN
ncbi:MAG: D-alanyl-D-alanine carboxypeptidase/D-alanyl-D-alanine-endopeptidase [Alphaproteobacteria bacterium]|nr:D-alanyl-D-alanine carboxypeptidase/D-alanyl-D-alanine-endopeptidase [Alphaproteobacteria bacterium]